MAHGLLVAEAVRAPEALELEGISVPGDRYVLH
jgi:hypothetical protein